MIALVGCRKEGAPTDKAGMEVGKAVEKLGEKAELVGGSSQDAANGENK